MVKNAGGNKTKGQARKFVTSKPSTKLRISEDECEIYAQVTKTLGNGMCHISDSTGKLLLCHIRGKFRGRSKRDNLIATGSWLLVGLREWETQKDSKLQNCDLLEVYSNMDKERLKTTVTTVNWSSFIANDNINSNNDAKDHTFEFTDGNEEEYQELIQSKLLGKKGIDLDRKADEEDVNVDDI